METIWDWMTVFAFAGLATLLLQRSTEEEPRDELWQYFPSCIGCAVTNYLGNEGQTLIAAALFAGVIMYIFIVLKVQLPKF
ncbi:MAG: XrtV sorting system accessory protein [Sphingorhabdus sp.]